MNPFVAKSELERVGKSLRRHADEIRSCAPAIAAKLDGLSRECEVKIVEIDRSINDRNGRTIDALRAAEVST